MSSYVDKSKKKLAPKAPARRTTHQVAPSQSPLLDTNTTQVNAGQPRQPSITADAPSLSTTSPRHVSSSHEPQHNDAQDVGETRGRVRLEAAAKSRSETQPSSHIDEQQPKEHAAKRRRVDIGADSSSNGTLQQTNEGAASAGTGREASHTWTDGGDQQPEQDKGDESVRARTEDEQPTIVRTSPVDVPRYGDDVHTRGPPSRRQHQSESEHVRPSRAEQTTGIDSQNGLANHEASSPYRDNIAATEEHSSLNRSQPPAQGAAASEAPQASSHTRINTEDVSQDPISTNNGEATTDPGQQQPQPKKRKQPVQRKRAAPSTIDGQGAGHEAAADGATSRKRKRTSKAQNAAATDAPTVNDANGERQAEPEQPTTTGEGEQPETWSEQQVNKRAKKAKARANAKPKPKPKPRARKTAQTAQPDGESQPNADANAASADASTQPTAASSTAQPEVTETTENHQLPTPRKKRKRAETPPENEDYEIDTSKVTIFDLMKDRRRGKKGHIEKEMENVDWDEVKRRRKEAEARARAAGQKASRREAQRELEEEDERRQEQQDAQQVDTEDGQGMPNVALQNGEIVIDNASLRMNRHQPINENVEVITEQSVTKRVTSRSHLFDNRRDPEDRIYTPPGRWTQAETDVFYAALKMFGTDFDMISKMFHGRNRRQIKHKFVREERDNGWRINAVLLGQPDPMNFEKYCEFTGQGAEDFKDPKELEAELKEDEERQRMEIEREREQAAEVQRKKQEAARAKAEAAQRRRSGEKVPRKRRSKKDKTGEAAPVADALGDGVGDGEQAQEGTGAGGGDVEQAEEAQAQQDGEQAGGGAKEKPKRTRKKAVNPKPRARKAGAADKNTGGQADNDGTGQGPTVTDGDRVTVDGEARGDNEVVQSIEID